MHFEWDESKNRTNREKHGLDFEVVFVFDWENALVADRTRQSEGMRPWAYIPGRSIRWYLPDAV